MNFRSLRERIFKIPVLLSMNSRLVFCNSTKAVEEPLVNGRNRGKAMPLEKSGQHSSLEDKRESILPKPKALYHGSPNGTIIELEPRVALGSKELGPLVFASANKAHSIAYLAHNNGLIRVCLFSREGVVYAIIAKNKGAFLQEDKGGYLYIVKSDTFYYIKGAEWGSKERVQPEKRIFYPSTLEAMIDNGVQVYFVNDKEREQILAASDGDKSIFQNLQSENQRRNNPN